MPAGRAAGGFGRERGAMPGIMVAVLGVLVMLSGSLSQQGLLADFVRFFLPGAILVYYLRARRILLRPASSEIFPVLLAVILSVFTDALDNQMLTRLTSHSALQDPLSLAVFPPSSPSVAFSCWSGWCRRCCPDPGPCAPGLRWFGPRSSALRRLSPPWRPCDGGPCRPSPPWAPEPGSTIGGWCDRIPRSRASCCSTLPRISS